MQNFGYIFFKKSKKKGKFLAKLPKCILWGKPPFLFRENSPKFKRGLKRNRNGVFTFLFANFDIKRKTN